MYLYVIQLKTSQADFEMLWGVLCAAFELIAFYSYKEDFFWHLSYPPSIGVPTVLTHTYITCTCLEKILYAFASKRGKMTVFHRCKT